MTNTMTMTETMTFIITMCDMTLTMHKTMPNNKIKIMNNTMTMTKTMTLIITISLKLSLQTWSSAEPFNRSTFSCGSGLVTEKQSGIV